LFRIILFTAFGRESMEEREPRGPSLGERKRRASLKGGQNDIECDLPHEMSVGNAHT